MQNCNLTHNVYEEIMDLENEIITRQKKKASLQDYIGMVQLYTIYAGYNHEFTKRIEHAKKAVVEHGCDKLITVEANDKKYHIIFDFLEDYSLGEYHTVDELYNIIPPSIKDKIRDSLQELEKILMDNVLIMYEKLGRGEKNAYIELRRIIKSKKKSYLYYYGSKELKKKSMGFIVIEESE